MTVCLSDAELVRRIEAGADLDAESELFHRMAPRVRLYGLRHLRDGPAADDLTQHVLMTTLQALRKGRLREPDKLASFVLGTCRLTVRNLQRGARRQASLLEESGTGGPPAATPALASLDAERLTHCLEGLNERERTVIVMTFYDDRTAADVAGALGLSDVNVRVIRHRAIRRLRTCMGVTT